MAKSHSRSKPENSNPDWQDRDIKLRPLVIFLIFILASAAATMVAMSALQSRYARKIEAADVPVSPLALERTIPLAGPMLQVRPRDELATHGAAEDAILDGYRWVDQEMGIAGIPVDRAMRILADGGLPARETQ